LGPGREGTSEMSALHEDRSQQQHPDDGNTYTPTDIEGIYKGAGAYGDDYAVSFMLYLNAANPDEAVERAKHVRAWLLHRDHGLRPDQGSWSWRDAYRIQREYFPWYLVDERYLTEPEFEWYLKGC
jgi:hypothetical protein